MATKTFGTTTTTILTAVQFAKSLLPADVATIQQLIKNDQIAAAGSHPIYSGDAFSLSGQLYIPNRGVLNMLPGDVVAVDNNGWPILVSSNSISFGSTRWVLT
jgi:hypothetical protein